MHRYWSQRRASRRAVIRGAGLTLAAVGLSACSGSTDDTANSSRIVDAGQTSAEVDPYKGKRGGKLVFQSFGDWGGTKLVTANNFGIHQGASFAHASLYQQRVGRPGVERSSTAAEPDLALAMPEQLPDRLTYVVKIRRGVRFQNGRELTSQDVKYSYDRYAFGSDSAMKGQWTFLDRVDAIDPETVVLVTKRPFPDMLGALANYNNGVFILAKEFEESSDSAARFMGAGAFVMTDRVSPVLNARFRRNPDYYVPEWPYFDEVEVLGTSDSQKRIADFVSRQTHIMYWLFENDADELKRLRPDAVHFVNTFPGYMARPRVDMPPFNDKRVRQALSLAMDRNQLNDATQEGRARDDQYFSWTVANQGFRKPWELPQARYWTRDVAEAKRLMAAAGRQEPVEFTMQHFDATVLGQPLVDQAELVSSQWRSAGIANARLSPLTFPQTAATVLVGNYEGAFYGPGGGGNFGFYPALSIRNVNWSPPEGVKTPTLNIQHINDPKLSELADKQATQFDASARKETFRQMEELAAEEEYAIVAPYVNYNWFVDPALRNCQIPLFMWNGNVHYVKYWWFARGGGGS